MQLIDSPNPTIIDNLPCHTGDPDLFFAERPDELEQAKALCVACPIRQQCLAAANDDAARGGVAFGLHFAKYRGHARKAQSRRYNPG